MLRAIVSVLLLLNVALFLWVRSGPAWVSGDREPQRLQRQIAPDAIQVLPDLPSPANAGSREEIVLPAAAGASRPPAAGSSSPSASTADPARAAQADPEPGLARRTSATETACLETGALTDAQWTSLVAALARAGVGRAEIAERRQAEPARWMVYMGRYADPQQWQHKADELHRLGVKFERVSTPPGLDPGLSLGRFPSQEDAAIKLDDLGRHGVHTARLVETPAGTARHLQLRTADERWRGAAGDQRFSACPAPNASL